MDHATERYDSLDALRAGLTVGIVALHAALPYTTLDVRSFKDASTHPAFDALVAFLYLFLVPSFYLLSGFFGARLYARHGPREFAANRLRRILVPLLLGWILLCPLVAMGTAFARHVNRSGSVAIALRSVEIPPPLSVGIYHLWFLAALVLFYAVAVSGIRLMGPLASPTCRGVAAWLPPLLGRPWRSVALAAPICLLLLPMPHRSLHAGAWLALSFVVFAFGWTLRAVEPTLPALGRYAWYEIGVAVTLFAVVYPGFRRLAATGRPWSASEHVAMAGALALLVALLVLGVTGVSVRHLTRSRASVRYLSEASYGIYVIHFPFVVWIAGMLGGVPWPAGAKWLLTLGTAGPLILLTYHYGIRRTPIDGLLGGNRARNRRTASGR